MLPTCFPHRPTPLPYKPGEGHWEGVSALYATTVSCWKQKEVFLLLCFMVEIYCSFVCTLSSFVVVVVGVCVCVRACVRACVCVWIYILHKFMEMVLQSIIFSWGSESAGTAPLHLTVWRSAGIFWSGTWWPGPSKGRTVSYSVGYDLGYIHSPQRVLIWCAVKHMLVSYT